MAVLVYETDLGVYLNKNAGLKNHKFKPGETMIAIELEGVNKVDGKNMMLVQEVQDKCWPLIKKEAVDLIKVLAKADAEANAGKRDKAIEAAIKKFNENVADKLINLARSVFTSFAKNTKDYSTYKWKTGFKIGVNAAMLGASIALTAVAGWTGVGTVVGAAGMVKSAASLAQQIANTTKDSEAIYKRIVGNVVTLKKQLASPNLKANTAKQAAATVVNKIFSVEIESLVVTVSGIESDFELLGNKVKGNKVNTTSLAASIPKMLDEQEKLSKDIDKLEKLTQVTKQQTSELKKLKKAQADAEKALDKLLNEIVGIREKVNEIEAWHTKYHRAIRDLKGQYNPKIVKGVGLATDFLLSAAQFVGGNFSDPASTLKDLGDSAKVVVTSLAMTNDAIGTIKDVGTSMYDGFKG